MRYFVFAFPLMVLLSGCRSEQAVVREATPIELRIPSWSFLAKASAVVAKGQKEIPRSVYVFPALRLDAQGRPTDALSHRLSDRDELNWLSSAPLGAELKAMVERRLKEIGFRTINFNQLSEAAVDHSIMVMSLYYREASPSSDNVDSKLASSWTTFSRISASTFPKNLNPDGRRDIMNQEAVTLFNDKAKAQGVIKRSTVYLLDYIGANEQWSEQINLLQ